MKIPFRFFAFFKSSLYCDSDFLNKQKGVPQPSFAFNRQLMTVDRFSTG